MSRKSQNWDISAILDAADRWREQCLVRDGSLFTDEQLWTAQNFERLHEDFVLQSFEGEGGFLDRLERQPPPIPNNRSLERV